MAAMVGQQRARFVERFGIGSVVEDAKSPFDDGVDSEWLNRVVEEDREAWKRSGGSKELLDDGQGMYNNVCVKRGGEWE